MSNPYIDCSSFFHAAKIQNILRKNAANRTFFRRTPTSPNLSTMLNCAGRLLYGKIIIPETLTYKSMLLFFCN